MGEGAPTEDVDRAVLTRRIDELERSQERARADFRVLRAWIDDAGERLWHADRRLA